MRITGFHVDGFGLLHDQRVGGIGPGTTVVLGPNEAGKSTLHAFLVRTLFGHPRANDAEGRHRYEPLHGGRHGGVVTCADERGTWQVHRSTTGSPRLRVVAPDGTESTGAEALLPLLGRTVDAERFEQVFAIDLDDLAGIGSLGDGALDDLLFDAATIGTGRSLRAARDEAVARRDALWTPSATTRPLSAAVARRSEARAALRVARSAARSNTDLRRRLDAADARVAALAEEQATTAARIALLERVRDVWPSWSTAAELRDRLADEVPGTDAAALAVAGEVAALAAGLAAHELAVEQLAGAEAAADMAARAVTQARAALGPGWDEERVAAVAVDAPSRERLVTAADDLRVAVAAATRAAEAADAAERTAARLAARLREATAALPAAPSAEDVTADEQAVAVLRRALPAVHAAPAAGTTSRRAVGGVLVAVGAVLAVLASVGVLPGSVLPVVVAGLAAALVGLGAHRLGRGPSTATTSAMAAVREDVGAAADRLGLAGVPSLGAVEQVAAHVATDRQRLRAREEVEQQLLRLEDEAADALAAAQDAAGLADERAGDQDAAERRWAAVCGQIGLAPDPDPGVVLALHARATTAAAALAEHTAAQDLVAHHRPRVDGYRSEVAAVAARLGHDVDGRAAVRLLPGLRDRVTAARDVAAQQEADRRGLVADLAAAERAVEQLLGAGPRGAAGRALLATADPAAWEEELAALRTAQAATAGARDAAVAERTELAVALDELGGDDAVARAQQALSAAELEVGELAERWAVADTAARLLEATIDRLEREQQPRVLARASALLHRATAGAWAQVRRLDSQVVVAHQVGGDPVPAGVLSRGTREQLWLCLRLALAEDLAQDRPLPLLVDDLLGTSDPERAAQVARVLADVARDHQVWLFTCHPRTAALVTAADPAAAVLRLERGGRVVGLERAALAGR